MSLPTPPAPSLEERPAAAPLRHLLARTRHGRLSVVLPSGRRLEVVGTEPGPHASLHLHRWRALMRVLLQGDLGLALAVRDGDLDCADLPALFEFGLANESAWGPLFAGTLPARWLARLRHLARDNSRRGSRHNIAFHYDLGNDFYRLWLDDTMLYSSALFDANADDTLEAAQLRRVDAIAELLDTPEGGDVLEIGCGWGTLAAILARRHNARVTGLTLSSQQLAFAQERAQQWGVADRLDLRLQDYRDVRGQFDRIVSIEMIEAVGERHWPAYFSMLRERLKPGGVIVLQAITIHDSRFAQYRRGSDFIQHCIFPGGMLPSPGTLETQSRRAGLVIESSRCFGMDYARTLAEWQRRFQGAWTRIEPLGYDASFKRLWTYYLAYCEAGFRAGRVDVGLYRLRAA